MKIAIQLFLIEKTEFHLFFDENNQPVVEANEQLFTSLSSLLEVFPFLLTPSHLAKTAQIINFLIKGLEFHYIDNIDQFKEDYYQRIEDEQSHPEHEMARLSDYGVYNVSTIHAPLIQDNQLTFFVKDDYTHLPYKVCVPLSSQHADISYELLENL